MNTTSKSFGWTKRGVARGKATPAADHLLRVVDFGLIGVLCVAPYVFGGRHEMGQLVLVSLISITAVAWFVHQSIVPRAYWPRTVAHAVLLLAAAIVTLQVIQLPASWLAWLAPRLGELLPLWAGSDGGAARLGAWHTTSLIPHETIKSLAMLVGYILLFVVVAGRIRDRADLERLLRCIAVAAVLMALFGIMHYATTDGLYFWFWKHPYRTASRDVSGAFVNHNHFAHFLVLGIGPLVAWLLAVTRKIGDASAQRPRPTDSKCTVAAILLGGALVVTILAIFLSLSRGGMIALGVAGTVIAAIYSRAGLVSAKYRWAALALGAVVAGALSLYGYGQISHRMGTLLHGSLDEIDRDGARRKIWHANVLAFQAGGVLGAGAGSHRMVYPLYLEYNMPFEYSHAESGYLQIGTENGYAGAALLLVGITVGGGWVVTCLRHACREEDQLYFGAIAGGLAASLAHSLVDFVWYIPACMSVAVVLSAMLLRLAQLTRSPDKTTNSRLLRRDRWIELAAASLLVGGWSVHTFIGPALASVHWDRYRRVSVSNTDLANEQWSELVARGEHSDLRTRMRLNDLMIGQLEKAVKHDPNHARARLRLAAKYIVRFELQQQDADNAMNRTQIKEAAEASDFKSQAALDAWLQTAFGPNIDWLRRASAEARQAVALCPLQAEGYLYLADLSFLDVQQIAYADAYIDQALRVRPYDAEVHYIIGERAWLKGNLETAIEHWRECFQHSGPHQLRIIYLLAGRMPAALFISTFEPDWRTLPRIWQRYFSMGQPGDVEALLAYASEVAKHVTKTKHGIPPHGIWACQASMYRDVGQHEEALSCLRRAYDFAPADYAVRKGLADELTIAGRYDEAEPHYRWCLSRRPTDQTVNDALKKLSKHRFALREADSQTPRLTTSWLRAHAPGEPSAAPQAPSDEPTTR